MEPKEKLKMLLSELEELKGRHTELVSVYVPAGYSINDIVEQLRNEQGTATNIKSKSTRKNVVDALEKILQHLKLYKQTPPNGLVIFCGNVSGKEGVSDIKLWSIEPPEPVKVKLYWCDQRFELGPLKEIVAEHNIYGLIVIDTKEATIGLLKGKHIDVLKSLDSAVPGKFIKGGQSQMRFQRVREGLINDFYKKIAEIARMSFPLNVKGILIGGPGPSKNDFVNGDYLPSDLKGKILDVVDIGYTNEYGLQELVERSKSVLSETEIQKENELLESFFSHLAKGDGLVTYGFNEVKKAITAGAAEVVLVSENVEVMEYEVVCECGNIEFIAAKSEENLKCSACGKKPKVIGKRKIIDALEALAKDYGTKVVIVSSQTGYGQQFAGLGGIGALLRWKYE